MSQIDDFFRSRLDQMIDLRKPLAVLATHIPWQELEAAVAHRFARQVRRGRQVADIDLFGPMTAVIGGGTSNAGRPRLAMRLMISLLYLKHTYNESDEALCERWSETPAWQYFSGLEYFENRLPCDPSAISRFRGLLGEEGVEELLVQTIMVAIKLGLIERRALTTVIVDSTVQQKAVAHPTDSRLLEVARAKLVQAAKANGIGLQANTVPAGRATYQAPHEGSQRCQSVRPRMDRILPAPCQCALTLLRRTRSDNGLLGGLSRVLGNSHARFSGESTPATACSYSTARPARRTSLG